MRNIILLVTGVVILGFFNFAIYQKEAILDNGQPVLLKLTPVDPRSIMQGDYMRLRYEIEAAMNKLAKNQIKDHHLAVIKIDERNIGHFVRIYNNEKLANNEKLIKFRYKEGSFPNAQIKPDTFLFQEGLQPLYQKAAYAIFYYNGTNEYLLQGMADTNLSKINPNANE